VTRKKSFRAGRAISEFDEVEFDLNDQKFKCKRAMQGAVLLEFASRADGESGGAAAGALYGFFADCMEASEYERFRAYINQDDLIIEMSELGDIASWLVEQYAARPTEPPSGSQDGPPTTGTPSTAPPAFVA